MRQGIEPEERDHGEHAAMIVRVSDSGSLLRMLRTCLWTVPSLTHSWLAIPALDRPSGHELENLALARRQVVRGSWTRRAATSSFTSAGSMTESPPAIRSSVSRKSLTSVTRLFNR